LKLLGVDDAEIDEALKSKSHEARLLIRSPQAGQVIEKSVVQGAAVEPGSVLFRVADLSIVWIEADVYERDLAFLHEGQAVEAVIGAFPGRTFTGKIDLIYPALNTETRTTRVRISVENPDLVLRPGMFATVRVQTPMSEVEPFRTALAEARREPPSNDESARIAHQRICPVTGLSLGSMGDPLKVSLEGRDVFVCCSSCESQLKENPDKFLAKLAPPPENAVLSVPEQAVIDTGAQKIVYVEREPGTFEGVEVAIGPRTGGFYPVISGLNAGDRVAAAGSFLLDAETRLNPAAASAYFGASGNGATDSAPSSATQSGPARSRGKQLSQFSDLAVKHLEKLSAADRELAVAQEVCPITGEPLGSMGVPVKVMLDGEPVFLCCRGCEPEAQAHPSETLAKVQKSRATPAAPEARPAPSPAAHNH
jgi:Cu(I)/Ag(I) efflux system membrane fusion protein